MQKPPTIYANIVNIRTTQTELILEFGVQIDAGPGDKPEPQNFEPEVRVVLAVGAMRSLGEYMLRTAQKHEAQQQEKTAPPKKAERS